MMVAQDVHKYINDNLSPFAELTMDGLAASKESTTIIQGRGEPIVTEYMSGAKSGRFHFDIRAKSADRVKANAWIQSITDHFVQHPRIELTNRLFFTAEPTVLPYPIERTDRGEYVYSAGFVVEYDQF